MLRGRKTWVIQHNERHAVDAGESRKEEFSMQTNEELAEHAKEMQVQTK